MNFDANQYHQGIVIRKSSGTYDIFSDGQRVKCVSSIIAPTKDSRNSPNADAQSIVVGDQVIFTIHPDKNGVIHHILPRRNQFTRRACTPSPTAYAHEQVIVANIEQAVIIASADNPPPGWNLIDRYLVTAEMGDMTGVICINKMDLSENFRSELYAELFSRAEEYRAIGYRVVFTSAVKNDGLDELKAVLQGSTSVFLGKSGVGKTSLLNLLLPGINHRTNEVSSGRLHRGKHTTTDLEMFSLENGGVIIDTPGMREFGLWQIPPDELAFCFPEMRPYLGHCRFGLDCAHDEEPGCAVRKAVLDGQIDPRRYKSYLRMRSDL
jgi:ribosome biogenesis GTPase